MKKSLADCSKCKLFNQQMVIGETNCEDDLSKVEILILAEAPALEEIKQGRPLVGRAGQIYREASKLSKIDTLPYYITNCVLCANIVDGKTVSPPEESIDSCFSNLKELLNVIKPKLIVALGTTPMKKLGIADSGISKYRGNFFTYDNIKVLVTFHPSYIARNGGNLKEGSGKNFLDDLNLAYSELRELLTITEVNNTIKKLKEPYSFKLPQECYSGNLMLYDIQHIYEKNKVYYIFKDKENNRKIIEMDDDHNYFYILNNSEISDTLTILPVEDVTLIKNKNFAPNSNCTAFEQDISLEQRHSIDYRYNLNKLGVTEPIVPLKIQFMDIEIYNEGSKEFPEPKKSAKKINSISFLNSTEGKVNVYLLRLKEMDKSEIRNFKNIKVKIFDSEKDLLKDYFKETKRYQPDVISAWNGKIFDYPYIYNRCKKIGVSPNLWSPLGLYKYDSKWDDHKLYGSYLLDQLALYKKIIEIAEGKKEHYKLDFIAKEELGEGKVAYEGLLDSMYEKDINKFIEYSATDTELLRDIENKRKYIELLAEMIRISSSTWYHSNSTMGLVDPIVLCYAKSKGLVCRNSDKDTNKRHYEGAFVNKTKMGLHSWVVDLDYTSLYPSVISTFNLDVTTYIARIESEIAKKYIYFKDEVPNEFDIVYYPWKKNSKRKKITKNEFDNLLIKNKGIVTITGCVLLGHECKKSFVGEICTYILNSRKKYKKIRDQYSEKTVEYERNENRQITYKILANSIYGVIANKHFRMFNVDLAEAITLTGQEVNHFAQYHTGQYLQYGNRNIKSNFQEEVRKENPPYILAGDTDSLFISLGDYMIDKGII